MHLLFLTIELGLYRMVPINEPILPYPSEIQVLYCWKRHILSIIHQASIDSLVKNLAIRSMEIIVLLNLSSQYIVYTIKLKIGFEDSMAPIHWYDSYCMVSVWKLENQIQVKNIGNTIYLPSLDLFLDKKIHQKLTQVCHPLK